MTKQYKPIDQGEAQKRLTKEELLNIYKERGGDEAFFKFFYMRYSDAYDSYKYWELASDRSFRDAFNEIRWYAFYKKIGHNEDWCSIAMGYNYPKLDWVDRHMIDVYDPGESSHGVASNLKLYDRVFDSRDEAENFLDPISSRYQDCGVKYKEPVRSDRAEQKYQKERERLLEMKKKNIDRKLSGFATCGNCRSKVNLQYVNHEYSRIYCPVCSKMFDYDQKKLLVDLTEDEKNLEISRRIKELDEQHEQDLKNGKYEIRWLVQADRHV